MKSIIFACVHNAGRSQMAAAFLNKLADPTKARALSAGTSPGDRVHPEVVTVMQEEGIDLSYAHPHKLSSAPLCRGYGLWTGRWRTPKASRSIVCASSVTRFGRASRGSSKRKRSSGNGDDL